MRILVLDFETYFNAEGYTLKALTTEEYVRDERFKAHMLGYWIPNGGMAFPSDVGPSVLETNGHFRKLIQESAVLVHHGHFDGLILDHHYDLRPKMWLDTLSMARLVLPRLRSHSLEALAQHFGLPAKNVPYNLFRGVRDLDGALYEQVAEGCRHDVWLTYQIAMKLLPHVPKEELQVIDCTIRMFTEPMLRLDRPRMQAFLAAEKLRKAKAMLAAGASLGIAMPTTVEGVQAALAGIETELQSADKFKLALEALGYPCPMKWSEKKQCDIPALAKNDDGMKALVDHEDSRVSALAAARLGVKSTLNETRAERLLSSDERGSLPVYLKYWSAKTGRYGGGDGANWQNFPRGGEIRKSILAPEADPLVAPHGYKLVIGDLSQIEYRLLCWLTGQTDKLEALVSGRDLYCEFASDFYGETITKDDKPRRGVGKQGILMGGYGAGKGTMISTAAGGGYGPPVYLSDDEGQAMVDLYRNGHPCVKAFWKWCDSALMLIANGGDGEYKGGVIRISGHKIWFPNGTAIDYAGMKWASNVDIFPDQTDDGQGYAWWEPTRKGWARIWGSKLTADIIQGLARVLIMSAMAKVAQHFKVVLQVHDEIVAAVPTEKADAVERWMLALMKTPPVWGLDIPLEAETIVSERYEK